MKFILLKIFSVMAIVKAYFKGRKDYADKIDEATFKRREKIAKRDKKTNALFDDLLK